MRASSKKRPTQIGFLCYPCGGENYLNSGSTFRDVNFHVANTLCCLHTSQECQFPLSILSVSRSAKDNSSKEEIIKILPVKCSILGTHWDFKVQEFTSRALVTLGMPPSFNEPSACQVSKFAPQTLSIWEPPQTSVKSVQTILSKFLVQGFPEPWILVTSIVKGNGKVA